MKIKLKVSNNEGFCREEEIDLANKFQERGIKETSPLTGYSASDPANYPNDPQQGINNQFNAGSGGDIYPLQTVNYYDRETGTNQTLEGKPTVNIKVRYDANEPQESRWNIDVYVDLDIQNLDGSQKRLITKHPKKVHKFPDSERIKVEWWIDGVKQEPIESQRP